MRLTWDAITWGVVKRSPDPRNLYVFDPSFRRMHSTACLSGGVFFALLAIRSVAKCFRETMFEERLRAFKEVVFFTSASFLIGLVFPGVVTISWIAQSILIAVALFAAATR